MSTCAFSIDQLMELAGLSVSQAGKSPDLPYPLRFRKHGRARLSGPVSLPRPPIPAAKAPAPSAVSIAARELPCHAGAGSYLR